MADDLGTGYLISATRVPDRVRQVSDAVMAWHKQHGAVHATITLTADLADLLAIIKTRFPAHRVVVDIRARGPYVYLRASAGG